MSSTRTNTAGEPSANVRYLLIAALIVLVFFMSYRFAVAKNAPESPGIAPVAAGQEGVAGGPSCACCGDAGTGEVIEGPTTVEGDVQRIFVDASAGYSPNVIKAVAGVPLEITFGEGFGCMAQVMSRELGFFEDLTTGPKTVTLPALEAGEYGFSCGMAMVFGTIVVE